MTKPALAVTQPDGTRYYRHPCTGEKVSSVSTIMKKGIPQQDWKVPWAVKMTAQHMTANWLRLSGEPHAVRMDEAMQAHETYAQERADIGDTVHEIVEAWSKGIPYPDPPKEVHGYVNRFIDFLTEKQPRFIENEVTLWSHAHKYAGTADFIIKVDGKILLADLKTGKRLHDEIGLQLSALAHADCILRPDGREDPVPPIEGLAGLHLRPRSWKLTEIPDISFDAFLAAQRIMDWTENIAPEVLPDARRWSPRLPEHVKRHTVIRS